MRKLPYGDGSIDCVVLDPPYMEGFYRGYESHLAGSGNYSAFRYHYSNGRATECRETSLSGMTRSPTCMFVAGSRRAACCVPVEP